MKASSVKRIFARMLSKYPHPSLNFTGNADASCSFLHDRPVYRGIEITLWKRTEEVSRKAFTDLWRVWETILTGYFIENSLQRAELVGFIGSFGGVTIHSRPLSYWGGSGLAFNDGARKTSRPFRDCTPYSGRVEPHLNCTATAASGADHG